jgi:FAD dependent oxidoreductase
MVASSGTTLTVDVLVVGDGTGGAAAAIQAARRGVSVAIVTQQPWLGGMLTSAGVCAPDGNELECLQVGFWGAFLRELERRQADGLDHAWVSFFTYNPRVGAEIFRDWAAELENLHWIVGDRPRQVLREGDRVVGVEFERHRIAATIIIDATELGDLYALGEIPYRWGWEVRDDFNEPSAPPTLRPEHQREVVQSLTWVAILQDYGQGNRAPEVVTDAATYDPSLFQQAWANHGAAKFLDYGRLPTDRLMLNWPIAGNDYATDLDRLVGTDAERSACLAEAQIHALNCVRDIQTRLDPRYGLAPDIFPPIDGLPAGLALYPYFRESRRLVGLRTVCETDILPIAGGNVAPLPTWNNRAESIAIGNYPNDHHYAHFTLPVQPKSLRWGGRTTGTPFAMPYRALIPAAIDGLLACDKNAAVSHVANGATRLQPVVLGLGQAAGMAAALCVERGCQPRDLDVRSLQQALVSDPIAPSAIVPLFDRDPRSADWVEIQLRYADQPETYPIDGYADGDRSPINPLPLTNTTHSAQPNHPGAIAIHGTFTRKGDNDYLLTDPQGTRWRLVTLSTAIHHQLRDRAKSQFVGRGYPNHAGGWIRVVDMES